MKNGFLMLNFIVVVSLRKTDKAKQISVQEYRVLIAASFIFIYMTVPKQKWCQCVWKSIPQDSKAHVTV